MEQDNNSININDNTCDNTLTFKVLLKFWKKESRDLYITMSPNLCADPRTFVLSIRKNLDIKKAHCLEEIWIMQQNVNSDNIVHWVKEINGRIKINIPTAYKETLLLKNNKLVTDPHYSEKYQ